MIENVIIIGSGPAGWTAGLYTGRGNLSPLLFSGSGERGYEIGGQLTTTSEVENFPGFPRGIHGLELMKAFEAQALRFGCRVVRENVTAVDFKVRPLVVSTAEETYRAHTAILCTGSTPRRLGIPGEDEFFGGRGVSTCATCDGAFFKDRVVCVVGGGDTAMEEATYLTHHASKVYLVHRRKELRASKVMQERALANPKIEFLWETLPVAVSGNDFVEAVRLANVKTGAEREIPIDGFFLAIGHLPNTSIFAGQIELDEAGYIVTDKRQRTSVEGVLAGGDVQDHVYRQAITAAGTGCAAAIEAERYLETAKEKSRARA
ncbi:MAG: thioredoxin-disulfide reductase [Planctomycetes bacterium]|nr:thioredoxin-disulfide reductase [Planctomycetota bacterium]